LASLEHPGLCLGHAWRSFLGTQVVEGLGKGSHFAPGEGHTGHSAGMDLVRVAEVLVGVLAAVASGVVEVPDPVVWAEVGGPGQIDLDRP
jgi:hypothetical protein